MPLFLEPGQRFPVVLESDRDKPEESRPTFWAKSQSMRKQQQIASVLDSIYQKPEPSVEKMFGDACQALAEVLVDWSNMGGIDYSPEKLADVLTFSEARELLGLIMFNQHVTPKEKKSTE